jgi:hypothetical protein
MGTTGERNRQRIATDALKRLSKAHQQAILVVMIVVLFALMIYVRRG